MSSALKLKPCDLIQQTYNNKTQLLLPKLLSSQEYNLIPDQIFFFSYTNTKAEHLYQLLKEKVGMIANILKKIWTLSSK